MTGTFPNVRGPKIGILSPHSPKSRTALASHHLRHSKITVLPSCHSYRHPIASTMIRSFGNDLAVAAWNRRSAKGVPTDILRTAYRKLMQVNNARTLNDLRSPPGNRLQPLRGKRKGQHGIRVNDQWRVCFRWHQGDAYDVEVCDYHDE